MPSDLGGYGPTDAGGFKDNFRQVSYISSNWSSGIYRTYEGLIWEKDRTKPRRFQKSDAKPRNQFSAVLGNWTGTMVGCQPWKNVREVPKPYSEAAEACATSRRA